MKKSKQKAIEFAQKELSDQIPEGLECDLKVGDIVTFINEYGVSFEGLRVIGFRCEDWFERKYKKFIFLNTSSYWFPHERNELIKEHYEAKIKTKDNIFVQEIFGRENLIGLIDEFMGKARISITYL